MHLAKVSTQGQITVPAEIRRLLGIGPGDKVLFTQNSDGEVVIAKAALTVAHGQYTVATAGGVEPEKDPVQLLIEELRNGPPSS